MRPEVPPDPGMGLSKNVSFSCSDTTYCATAQQRLRLVWLDAKKQKYHKTFIMYCGKRKMVGNAERANFVYLAAEFPFKYPFWTNYRA